MEFCWVTLPVKDFNKSLDFYHGVLGLPISSRIKGNGMDMAMLGKEDQPKIEIISFEGRQPKEDRSDMSVGIAVPSMEAATELLRKNNIPISRGPISPSPDIQFIYIKDPDGYDVQLVEMKS